MRAITQSISSLIFLISVFSISAYAQPITDSGVGSPITEKGTLEFTVYVPSNGMTTEARVVRKKNTYYYLVVSGSAYFSRYDRPGGQLMNDACYEFNSKPRPVPMDVLKNNQNVNVCNSRYNRNSQYRTKPFIPKGPLRFWIFDTDYRDNSGGLRVDVYRLDKLQGNNSNNSNNSNNLGVPNKPPNPQESFDNMLERLTDQKHLDSLNFDKILNSLDKNDTSSPSPITSNNTWNSGTANHNQQANQHQSGGSGHINTSQNQNIRYDKKNSGPQCRDQNPDPSSQKHRFDTNNNPNDQTYINCIKCYEKHLKLKINLLRSFRN